MAASRMHGITSNEFTHGVRSIDEISTNIIGMVCTGDDADAGKFPLNTPVFHTSAYGVLAQAGTKGTLAKALDAVVDQTDAQIVIVRVPESKLTDNGAAQQASTVKGVQALRRAKALTGYAPKIIGAPELDTQSVAAELATVAAATNAFAYVAGLDSDNISEITAYRENFGQRDLMIIDNDFTGFNPVSKQTEKAATIARILGARARLDDSMGWHKSISNTEILGVTGLKHGRTYGLMDKSSEVNTLNNADITTLIRDDGYRVWGNRTCASDPVRAFESTVRASKHIRETLASQFLWAMDLPMHPSLMIDIMMSINAKLAYYVTQGRLLGARVFFDRTKLDTARVSSGIFAWDYEFTVPPPLENPEFNQHVSDRFIVNLVDRVVEFGSSVKAVTV